MLVESLGYNLLSVSRLADFGFNVLFTEVDCQVFHRDNHKMVFTGIRRGDLYIVDFTKKAQPRTCLIAKSSKGWLWHRRLGHVGMRNLDKLIKGDHILGVKDVIFYKDILQRLPSRKTVWRKPPREEHHDHEKTARATSYGSLWSQCLQKTRWKLIWSSYSR